MRIVMPQIGRVLLPPINTPGTFLMVTDVLYAAPFWPTQRSFFVDQIGVRVSTAGTGSNLNIRMGLYRNARGVPGERVFGSDPVSLAAGLGGYSATMNVPISLRDEPLWGVVVHQGGNTTNCTLAGCAANASGGDVIGMLGVASFANMPVAASQAIQMVTTSFAYGPLPERLDDLSWNMGSGSFPLVGLRRSA